jgi:Zn/Cd-binding protein ZinT
MKTAEQIRNYYEKKIKQDIERLQKKCKHEESRWVEECWAIAHFTGRRFLMCKRCDKILKTVGELPKPIDKESKKWLKFTEKQLKNF